MAIGVRILSDNLSGKTVNVTYLPVSGGTIDLGTQTIPFNNIDSNPWGTYQVYVPEYDYTYSLTISNNSLGQTFVLLSTPSGNTSSWASSVLNFGDLTAQVIDYGISTNDWDISDIYPLTEKGYLYLFSGRGNFGWGDWLFLATDEAGQSLMQYSGNTGNWEYDVMEGEIGYFAWEDLGVMKYTDGTSGYTFTWTSGTNPGEFNQFNIEWDWDGANRDGKFIFSLRNGDTGDKEYYLADHGTHTLLTTSNTNTDGTFFTYQWNSNFFTEIGRETNTWNYLYMKIYDTTGTLLQTYDLTGNTYTHYSLEFFGNNLMFIMFYNWNDTSVDYYIRTYNGTNNQSDFTTHNRTNYPNYNTSSDSGQWPEEYDMSSMSLMLYQNGSNYGNLTGNTVLYCDFIWCLDNSEVLHTEVFQDTGVDDEKAVYTWFNNNKRPITHGSIGDGNFYTIMLTPTGVSYNSLGSLSNFGDQLDIYDCSPGYIIMTNDSGDNLNRTMHFLSSGNTVTNTQQFYVTNYPWNYNSRERYGFFYLTNYTDTFYAKGSTGTFTQLSGEYYNNTYYSAYFDSNYQTGPFVAVNTNADPLQIRAFDKTSSNSQFQLSPNNGNWDIRCGKDRILYIYNDNNTGNCNIKLYGFDGTLKNSQEFNSSGWDSVWAVKDRYVLVRYENSERTCYLISDTNITSVTVSDYNNYQSVNDWVNWDD